MSDFATADFLAKNVRVRPDSGAVRAGEEETKTVITEPNVGGGRYEMEDEEKFNNMVRLDMDEQRKQIKERREELERLRQIEEEKKAKKRMWLF